LLLLKINVAKIKINKWRNYIMAKKEKVKKNGGVIKEFKAFITRGNVLDMAVGVIMGSAFGAIVTAFTNILLSVATWAVPGGLKGLVTVLPAVNDAQKGAAFFTGKGETGIEFFQKFTTADVNERVIQFAAAQGKLGLTVDSADFIQWKNSLLGLYSLHGTTYTYNMSSIIDWGTFINAIISFLIIALTLFIIIKTVASIKAAKANLDAQIKAKKEAEWEAAHPEEAAKRRAEKEAAEAAAAAGIEAKPEDIVLLEEIRDSVKALASK
jgi:large-conductance mechanosensitive channel